MTNEYLKLPIRFSFLFESKQLVTCNLLDSIYRNLHLLITTANGENINDSLYGVDFWDYDYDIHLSNDARREIILNGLNQQIARYEKRIINVVVEAIFRQSMFKTQSSEGMRRRIEIKISGKIKRSLEPFSFQTGFFIGPFSLG